MSRTTRGRAAWRVRIPAHSIPRTGLRGQRAAGAYDLPEHETVRFEAGDDTARIMAARALHVERGLPHWRPYLDQTVRLAEAERCYEVAAAGRA